MIEERVVTIRKQLVAPKTIIDWNPVTNGGEVTFYTQCEVKHNGEFVGFEPGIGELKVSLEEILPMTLEVEGQQVPAVLIMAAIKSAFEHFLNR